MKVRIGELTFDGGRRLLQRGAEPLHLSPKAFQLLALLLARRPDAVAKDEIRRGLWPLGRGSGGNLASVAAEVRRALGEGPPASWLRTVHGFGYAFEGPADEIPDSLRHCLVRGRQEVELGPGANLLGREREATVRLAHPSVAREHARILVSGDQAVLENLAGPGATRRGTEAVTGGVVLRDGDLVRVGRVELVYRVRPVAAGG